MNRWQGTALSQRARILGLVALIGGCALVLAFLLTGRNKFPQAASNDKQETGIIEQEVGVEIRQESPVARLFRHGPRIPEVPEFSRLLDQGMSLKERVAMARKVGKYGSLADWQKAFSSELPEAMLIALVESVGSSGREESGKFLRDALQYPVQAVRRAVLRGLGDTGRDEDAVFLGDFLAREDLPIEETTEAALALGTSSSKRATSLLIQSYAEFPAGELGDHLILALAMRPWKEASAFVGKVLANPGADPAHKRELLSGLGYAGQVSPDFFSPYLLANELEVRQGAYEGLGALASPVAGAQLFACLQREEDPGTRIILYEGLVRSRGPDPMQLHHFAYFEKNDAARIYAARAVAAGLRGRPATDPVVQVFSQTWVPELTRRALTGSRAEAFQVLTALSLVSSSQASESLIQIARQAGNPKVREKAQKYLEIRKQN